MTLFFCLFIFYMISPVDTNWTFHGEKSHRWCGSNSRWDDVYKRCIECSPGYFGTNCSIACPYPSYGKICRKKCECKKTSCALDVGCIINKEVKTRRMITSFMHKTKDYTHPVLNTENRFKLLTTWMSKRNQRIRTSTSGMTKQRIGEPRFKENFSEESLGHFIKSYISQENKTGRTLSIITLVCVLAILILLVLAFALILVKRGSQICKIFKDKQPVVSSESDHCLNNPLYTTH